MEIVKNQASKHWGLPCANRFVEHLYVAFGHYLQTNCTALYAED
ncbi:hypothetical protein [Vibrio aquimaris]|nr:hypothetical protein [Vibrio aquimaris]